MNAKIALKVFLNGGSSVLFTFLGATIFVWGWTYGLSVRELYTFPVYIYFGYILIQGLQFNLSNVSGTRDAMLDILFSILPFILWLYVYFSLVPKYDDIPEWWSTIFYQYLVVVILDLAIFTPASLKMLLFTDKNATSGGRG